MCHYKKGNQDDIIFVFSCPGKYEEKSKEPASGQTGKNLNMLLEILDKELIGVTSFKRNDINITNSTTNVEFKARTNRTEATINEVLEEKNLNRLYNEIKNIKKLIICAGKNANLAVDKILEKKSDIIADKVCIEHIGMQSINSKIKKDIKGTEIRRGEIGNTKKRLEVIALDIKKQIV